jgi:NAD(P)H dehydrogenase (quinone)
MDRGSLIDELSEVFSAATFVYGDQKSTTTNSMMIPVLHHGMIIVGAPDTVFKLTQSGGPMALEEV